MRKSVLILSSLLFTVAFAGCVDEELPPEPVEVDDDGPGSVPEEGLTVESVVDAPDWSVGDYFGHHIFFGSEDTQGTHIDVVVTEAGSSYTLLPSDPQAAKWEAAWDFPMMGELSADLETTAFTADWNLYDFPLSDGKEWTTTFDPLFNGPRDLTLTATFNEAIKTVGQGTKAGFEIVGVNDEGLVELTTDYIPVIGWYSELNYIDRTSNPDASDDDFVVRVWAMGQGNEWEGNLYTAEATGLINGDSPCFAPLNADSTPNPDCVTPATGTRFSISDDADELYGVVFVGALAGVSDVSLTHNQVGQSSWQASSSDMNTFDQIFDFVELESPVTGDWVYSWTGGGVVSVAFTQLWEIQITETAFTP